VKPRRFSVLASVFSAPRTWGPYQLALSLSRPLSPYPARSLGLPRTFFAHLLVVVKTAARSSDNFASSLLLLLLSLLPHMTFNIHLHPLPSSSSPSFILRQVSCPFKFRSPARTRPLLSFVLWSSPGNVSHFSLLFSIRREARFPSEVGSHHVRGVGRASLFGLCLLFAFCERLFSGLYRLLSPPSTFRLNRPPSTFTRYVFFMHVSATLLIHCSFLCNNFIDTLRHSSPTTFDVGHRQG
jgi:hypothetical protein